MSRVIKQLRIFSCNIKQPCCIPVKKKINLSFTREQPFYSPVNNLMNVSDMGDNSIRSLFLLSVDEHCVQRFVKYGWKGHLQLIK